uniref:Xanthine dehydrogenase family protein subunit M n=1 Tax=Gracilinema caldarium TaxID=215591 RepID=A0A7C3IGN1_9SPIR
MLHQFSYAAPRSKAELFSILDDQAGNAKVLAGGTDLLVNIRNGVMKPQLVVDIKKVAGYEGISYSPKEGLIFRPTVTINDILRDPSVRDHYPLLQDCGHDLASYQVRNRATIMGNVVNASPCSDMAPALLCLGAQAVIASSKGTRQVPFKEFFTGVKKTVLSPNEVLEAIVIPPSSAGGRGAYRKLKRINGHDLGIIGVAVYIQGDVLRIGVSSAAPTPVVTQDLPATVSVEDAVAAARSVINPISDVRCSKEYREFMVEVFVKRLLEEVRK